MIFYDRIDVQKSINDCIKQNIKIQIIHSEKGIGKTTLIRNIMGKRDCYIDISNQELIFKDRAESYTFLRNIAKAVEQEFPNIDFRYKLVSRHLDRITADVSLSTLCLNFTYSIPKNYDILGESLKKFLQKQDKKIYIHVEEVQKIDYESLKFLLNLAASTDNIFIFLEYCSQTEENKKDFSDFLELISDKLEMNINNLELPRLDWRYVEQILQDKNIPVNEELKLNYEQLNGNLKELFSKNDNCTSHDLDKDELFLMTFLETAGISLTVLKIKNIFRAYQNNRYVVYNIEKNIENLIRKGYADETDYGKIILIKKEQYGEHEHMMNENINIEALSTFYIPIITDDSNDDISTKIEGLKILLPLYSEHEDERLEILIPYISKYLLPLNYNIEDINYIYDAVRNNPKVKYEIMKLYMMLGEYNVVFKELRGCTDHSSFIRKILFLTAMLHSVDNNDFIEETIDRFIRAENDPKNKSAMYTCLVAQYMKTKSSKDVLDFVNKLYEENQIEELDRYIIEKNISIYYDTKDAIESLKSCITYFQQNNYLRLEIASNITLATRMAQSGKIKEAKSILKQVSESPDLTSLDILYIDNNLTILDFYDNTAEISYDKLFKVYNSLEDEYTKLLASNNLLIYETLVGNYEEARKFATEIEEVGLTKYKFDEFLHLSYLNLFLFYNKFASVEVDSKVFSLCNKLKELQDNCESIELKKYINSTLNEDEKLVETDKWFFMSQKEFRPAFMGHWLINAYDN